VAVLQPQVVPMRTKGETQLVQVVVLEHKEQEVGQAEHEVPEMKLPGRQLMQVFPVLPAPLVQSVQLGLDVSAVHVVQLVQLQVWLPTAPIRL